MGPSCLDPAEKMEHSCVRLTWCLVLACLVWQSKSVISSIPSQLSSKSCGTISLELYPCSFLNKFKSENKDDVRDSLEILTYNLWNVNSVDETDEGYIHRVERFAKVGSLL